MNALINGSGSPYYNLKALIKAIRQCKTLQEERHLIAKESSCLRSSLKSENVYERYSSMAKVLYLHMLGESCAWASVPCLVLVASPKFSEKRLGYLGINLVLDESQEVLMLLTNSLKNDMNHSNMYAVGLALGTFANIAGEEMCRDLANEIEKLLGSSNTYIRKKAALCALRVVRRVPELIDHFISKGKSLLQDRNHGVLLAGVTLVQEMCAIDEACCDEFRKAVPLLVKHLKSLVTTGYSPEHDVGGITDPFLQVKILHLLRLLGRGSAEASETMNDILAQVATNTDATKNVGNSILYETVLTILEIEADSGLRVMAINILGKFLGNRDNNIRYVALNTLNKVALSESAVQRHRDVVLSCLSDGDISIRRRALELSYALINEGNVRILMRELLAFLEVADNEFKLGLTTQICLAAERYAPNKRWHIDTVLRVLKLAGNYVREEVLSSFIRLVAHTSELQCYTAQRLYQALQADISQESLTLAGVWILGEFSDIMLQAGPIDDGEEVKPVTDSEIVDLLQLILHSPYANSLTRQFTLTALAKLSVRFREAPSDSAAAQQERISEIMAEYASSPQLELQQRVVEFGALFDRKDLVMGVLEHMPAPEIKATIMGTVSEKKPVGSTRTDKDSLVDLMGDEAGASVAPAPSAAALQNTQDLLADIFGGGSSQSSTMPASAPKSAHDDIMGLFGNNSASTSVSNGATNAAPPVSSMDLLSQMGDMASSSAPAPAPAPAPAAAVSKPQLQTYPAYEKNGLKITLTPKTLPAQPGMVQILVRFAATEGKTLEGVNFQAAVPKTQQLQMLAMSNGDVAPGSTETQQMRVIAPPGAQVRLRLRISYTSGGVPVTDQQDFSGFPADLTSPK